MAHFAQLDENNVVIQVIVVDDKETRDVNGIEHEALGIAFCKRMFGIDTRWLQTSYNGNIRVRYAGIGYTFLENEDAFIGPKPYDSWSLNSETLEWDAPVPRPLLTEAEKGTHFYVWNESEQKWDLTPLVS